MEQGTNKEIENNTVVDEIQQIPTTASATTTNESLNVTNGNLVNGNPNSTITPVNKLVAGIPVPNTLIDAFNYTVNKIPNKTAMKVKRGSWIGWSWAKYKSDVMSVAKSLVSLGITKKGSSNIIGFNSPEWHIAFLGSVFAGGVPTGVYTTSSSSQCEYFANNSEAQFIFVEDEKQLAKYLQIKEQIPNVKAIVVMTPLEDQNKSSSSTTNNTNTATNGKEPVNGESGSSSKPNMLTKSEYPSGYVYSWEEFLNLGKDMSDQNIENIGKTITSEDVLTLIYTSGTTSLPKGCVLTHHNVVWTVYSIASLVLDDHPHNERFVSYLPLSHIAEQVVTLHAPILFGILVCFADKEALQGTLLNTLLEVKPTIFFGVPRVWEKIQLKITSILNQSNGIKKKLVSWAQVKGVEGGYKSQKGEKKPRGYGLAKKLVFNKIIKSLGFQYTKLLASAAAPISRDTLDFFLGLGITVTEAFGMSELTGPQTLGYPKYKTGSVGKTIPGSAIKIADDGEICIKGPNCFSGYWKNEEATKEVIDSDGWVHTGDIGRLDESGYLFITDRKKELIITAGGENIPPTLIEGHLRQIIGLSEAVVVGDRQKYLIALFTVSIQAINTIPSYGHPLPTTIEEASTDKYFNEYLNSKVQEINSKLPNVQTIKKFKVLPLEFSEAGVESEITPTKKLKRRVITKKYDSVIREMYGDQYTEGQFNTTSNPIPPPVQTSPSLSSINNHIKSLNSSGVVGVQDPKEEPVIVNSVQVPETNIPVVKSYTSSEIKETTSIVLPPTSLIVADSNEPSTENVVVENVKVDEQPKIEETPKVEEPVVVERVKVEQQPKIEETPKVEEQVIEPVIEQPKVEEPPKVVEQVIEPVVEQPKVEESIVVEQVVTVEQVIEPVVEQPKVEEPIVVEPVKIEETPKVEEPVVKVEESPKVDEQVKIEETPKVEEPITAVPVVKVEEPNENNQNNDKNDKDDSSTLSTSYSSDESDSSDSDTSTYTSTSDSSHSSDSYTKSGSSVNTSEMSE